MNSCLTHHGIKGQKWGVRRFQNEDGTYTPYGKMRRFYERAQKKSLHDDVQSIIDSMSEYDKSMLMGEVDESGEYHDRTVVKRFIKKVGGMPVSALDLTIDRDNEFDLWRVPYQVNHPEPGDEWEYGLGVTIVTRDGEFRGKGYAAELVERAKKWYRKHESDIVGLDWVAYAGNAPSNKLAKSSGFTPIDETYNKGDRYKNWYYYR